MEHWIDSGIATLLPNGHNIQNNSNEGLKRFNEFAKSLNFLYETKQIPGEGFYTTIRIEFTCSRYHSTKQDAEDDAANAAFTQLYQSCKDYEVKHQDAAKPKTKRITFKEAFGKSDCTCKEQQSHQNTQMAEINTNYNTTMKIGEDGKFHNLKTHNPKSDKDDTKKEVAQNIFTLPTTGGKSLKSVLQERIQRKGGKIPHYVSSIIENGGKCHSTVKIGEEEFHCFKAHIRKKELDDDDDYIAHTGLCEFEVSDDKLNFTQRT